MKRALPLLAPLFFSSCALVSSSKRWAPVELERPAGVEVTVSDHAGRFAGMNVILSGAGKVATVPLSPEGLHLSIRDRSTSIWALGVLLPVLPTFGIGPDEEDNRVSLALRVAYEGESTWGAELPTATHSIDPRAVRILPGGIEAPLSPVAWSVHGQEGDLGTPLPAPGSTLNVSAHEPLVLFFEVTHAELESAGECVLELEVGAEDQERQVIRLRLRPGRVWHFTLLG